jgi:hypothetical protein
MRTTITLDEDVAAKLRSAARKTGRPFKEVVNSALRAGLAAQTQANVLAPFAIPSDHFFRGQPGRSYDKVEAIFDELDSPQRLR